MSDKPMPLSDDDLSQVIGGVAGATAKPGVTGGGLDTASDIYATMALFQSMAQEMRNAAREDRSSQLLDQRESLMNAADKMREAANAQFAGAIAAGSMSIAGGVASLAAGSVMAGGLGDKGAAAAGFGAGSHADGLDKMTALGDRSTGLSSMASTGMLISAAGTSYGASIAEAQKADHDAMKSQLEAQAKIASTTSQHANDMMQQMMDVVKDVRDKLSSIEQSRLETARGIARNI